MSRADDFKRSTLSVAQEKELREQAAIRDVQVRELVKELTSCRNELIRLREERLRLFRLSVDELQRATDPTGSPIDQPFSESIRLVLGWMRGFPPFDEPMESEMTAALDAHDRKARATGN